MGIEEGPKNRIEMTYPKSDDLLAEVDTITPEEEETRLGPILEMLEDSSLCSKEFLQELLAIIKTKRQDKQNVLDPNVREWYSKIAAVSYRGLGKMTPGDQRYLTSRKMPSQHTINKTMRRFSRKRKK